MMCGIRQIDGMRVYVASVNIINIFYSDLVIYVDHIIILWDV